MTNQASGATTSLACADALVRVPSRATRIARGEPCDVILLGELGA